MFAYFYDIESLSNVFTLCAYSPTIDHVDIFYLLDEPNDDDPNNDDSSCETPARDFAPSGSYLPKHPTIDVKQASLISERIYKSNGNFSGSVAYYNLANENDFKTLIKMFGISDAPHIGRKNTSESKNQTDYFNEYEVMCDTDTTYNDDTAEGAFLFGYNSYNYDLTMLAHLVDTAVSTDSVFTMPVAKYLRVFNDTLFTPQYKSNMPSALAVVDAETGRRDYSTRSWKIRKNMLFTGRHVDVARLNEKQGHVALKRLLGMMGFQILESDKLGIGCDTISTADELADLIAYNVSDCVNLYELFKLPLYKAQFEQKRGLLSAYPDIVYDRIDKQTYKPDIRPGAVRKDRLFIDSSSAQFVTKTLSPYGVLDDIEYVSFNYPDVSKLKPGESQHNILEETRIWAETQFANMPQALDAFHEVYEYYKFIEGKNFNDSDRYREKWVNRNDINDINNHAAHDLKDIPKRKTTFPYFNSDGTPSSCYVTVSVGGIHGAEYAKSQYEADMHAYLQELDLFNKVRTLYPDPLDLRQAKTVTVDGVEYPYSKFLKSGATITKMKAMSKDKRAADFFKQPTQPQLFIQNNKGSWELDKRKYSYTSIDNANHEDFTSYYPGLLMQMNAFYNADLGEDRYSEIFANKQRFGKLMKDKSLSDEDRNLYAVKREGTKLLLNSASGAGATLYDSNIRMNNRILSMRCIGQLFTWRIGQAQTLAGAKITSTNTDGLYSVMEPTLNNQILEKESASIGVAIEPEPLILISKDSNNRIETELGDINAELISASGGSLACHNGPRPDKSLAHAAIIDWATKEYLICVAHHHKNLDISQPFDETLGMNILQSAQYVFDQSEFLRMFQNLVASSTASMSYVYSTDCDDDNAYHVLQHYNRVFYVKHGTPKAQHLHTAAAATISKATIASRKKTNSRIQQHERTTPALAVLAANGIPEKSIPANREAKTKKVPGIDPDWSVLIDNRSLWIMSPTDKQAIIDVIDYDKYLQLLKDSYENNWRNTMQNN